MSQVRGTLLDFNLKNIEEHSTSSNDKLENNAPTAFAASSYGQKKIKCFYCKKIELKESFCFKKKRDEDEKRTNDVNIATFMTEDLNP